MKEFLEVKKLLKLLLKLLRLEDGHLYFINVCQTIMITRSNSNVAVKCCMLFGKVLFLMTLLDDTSHYVQHCK